jgi:ATP-binding cassette subfamily B protein/subfamily B ATP-binding cassette protein MsbA
MRVVKLNALSGPIIEWLGAITIAAALLAGAYLVMTGTTHFFGMRMTDQAMEAETLLQLYILLAAIADPVRKLASVYTKMQSGFAAADRIFAVLDKEPRVRPNTEGMRVGRLCESVEFRDVSFSYDPEQPILTNINLTVKAGEIIAIVGRNGCGKTTLVGLLPRFYDPDHGAILIDGQDIRKMNVRSLRNQIGIVTQDTFLFDDTIYNNIAYGCRKAKPEEVEAAAVRAGAHDFIMKLPQGYQTILGESAYRRSGGEKQRIALARAMLRDPSILILDEFTSQVDATAESLIHREVKEFVKERTTFLITHKLQTLEIVDRIVVLDEGRILAVGSHQELMEMCPLYQTLYEASVRKVAA